MSYNPSLSIQNTTNPFFSAYRSTNQTPTIPGDFQADNFLNCLEDGDNAGKVKLSTKAYLIGEIKAVASGNKYNLYDIGISGSDGLAEGYQVRCNASGTVVMDDSTYGIGQTGASICIRSLAVGPNSTANASANQIRVMGVKTK